MIAPDPNSRRSRCLAVLRDGPATTGEVAAELGIPSKLAGTHLAQLHALKKITRKPFGTKPSGRGSRWLWSIAA